MKFVGSTLPTPAENLACDEALLDLAEASGVEFLRIWESPVPFVVVGYGNKVAAEVNTEACARLGVPVLRRCSGGGTVVQGPGCLSYAVCLQARADTPLATVTGANRFVMQKMAAAIGGVLDKEVTVLGCTDLAVRSGDRWLKFSGNAQRRRRHTLLFHGTILYSFNVTLVAELLRFPSKQPDYRENRGHLDFITNIPTDREEITRAVTIEWRAETVPFTVPKAEIHQLVEQRYSTAEWNLR